jgi:hypothetical protein
MKRALTWERLTQITKNQKPYRGTINRFPITDRRHNTKCFYVKEIDGETVYEVTYGFRHLEHYHTKEEYEVEKQKRSPNIYERNWEEDESKKYVSYTHVPRELGVVRSDNTFEFVGKYYGQGDNTIMSSWSNGYFFRSSRHGGMIYREGNGDNTSIFHPIFKGMRINLDTMMPHESSTYQVIGKRVSRKDAKQFLVKFEDFYKINEVMFKTLDWKMMMETTLDVIHSLADKGELTNYYLSNKSKNRMIEWADANINIAPLDSALAFAVGHDIYDMYRKVRSYVGNGTYSAGDPINVYDNIKRKLNKELYRRHSEVMKPIHYEMGKYFPPSEWGLDITVNGKEVEQF